MRIAPKDPTRGHRLPTTAGTRTAIVLLVAVALLAGCAARRDESPAVDATRWIAPICTSATGDADADGLGDECELALARGFAPLLVVDRRECLWTSDDAGGRLAGGWLYAAQPVGDGRVRIAYLPAYLRDCGWTGAPCLVRERRCGAHAGDSELVLVDVARDSGGRWATTGVFLSAHCLGRSDGRCRWYRGDALARFAWVGGVRGGAPVVWVASGKHGGYPTRDDCDAGHWGFDSCDANVAAFRFPVHPARNIGSRAHPAGCVSGDALAIAGVDPAARECPWDDVRPFRGWQPAGSKGPPGSSYARQLARFAGL